MKTSLQNSFRSKLLSNGLDDTITQKTKYNDFLTYIHNRYDSYVTKLTNSQKHFLKTAWQIVVLGGRPFCCNDFEQMSKTNFRQKIYELKEWITSYELTKKTRPQYYRLIGIDIPGDAHKFITQDPTWEIGSKMYNLLLDDVGLENPTIHDIKIQFETDLHSILVKCGCSMNPYNHSIKISDFPTYDNNITAKLLLYPKKAQLDIGCTYKPFIYDISGISELVFYLGMIYQHLTKLVLKRFTISPVSKWIITHYHFGKDGSIEINGQSFHFTFTEFKTGLIRFYSKKFSNQAKTVARLEQVQTPKTSINDTILDSLRLDDNSEGDIHGK